MEDSGHLSQIGYTSGARSKRELGWAKNVIHKMSQDEKSRLDYESASVFAMFWNMCRTKLPTEIIDDFDNFFQKTKAPRMNTSKELMEEEGKYTINDTQRSHTFHGVKMAPPCGFFGVNYSRYGFA